MSDLVAVGLPDNLRVPPNLRGARMVQQDVFNICNRIKEIDPNLYVVVHEGHPEPFVVMEQGRDGNVYFVSRYDHLEADILEDLQRMLRTPFKDRFNALAKKVDAENEANENAWMESEGHERFIHDFKKALVESNISDAIQGSYSMRVPKNKRGK